VLMGCSKGAPHEVGAPPARVGAAGVRGVTGLKDKTCWFCGDFSALQRGKFTILVGRVCLDYVNTEASWVRGCPMVRDGLAACDNDLDSNASRM